MTNRLQAVILGASGYTGAELLRLLKPHPRVELRALTGESQAGKPLSEVYPHLSLYRDQLVANDQVDYAGVDVVFCCLPHGTTQEIIAALPSHVRIVDLSADFRLHDEKDYLDWYGHPHRAPKLQREAVYGLSEWCREQIVSARLVANPGCYPTCTLLAVLPLVRAGLIEADGLIVDAMSGVTGAGRKATQGMLFCEVNEGAKAYGVGGHRHVSEMEQEVGLAAAKRVHISFTAHLVPMNRGMSATIHAQVAQGNNAALLREELKRIYAHSPFVQVCEAGIVPSTHEVRGTNQCKIAVVDDRCAGRVILVSVIDNLVKGASGQAVQNMNLMFGFEETLGLELGALFP